MTLGCPFQDLFKEVFEAVDNVWSDLEEGFEVLYCDEDVEWDVDVSDDLKGDQVEWDEEVDWDDDVEFLEGSDVHWMDDNEQFGHVLEPMDIDPSKVDWDDDH